MLVKAAVAAGTIAFVASLAAQEPAPAPKELDLPTIAKLLEGDGKLPDVLAAMTDKDRRAALDDSRFYSVDEGDVLLDVCGTTLMGLPVAVKVIAASSAEPMTRVALVREIRACATLAAIAADVGRAQRMSPRPDATSWEELAPVARRRGAVLVARFLREYPLDPGVGHVVALFAREAGKDREAAVREHALRLLGENATPSEQLMRFNDLLRTGSFDAAEQALAAAERARSSQLLDLRTSEAEHLSAARRRLVAAREWEQASRQEGLAGRIARLRMLQLTDVEAAVALARQLVTDDVPHALPSTVLAVDGLWRGELVERARHSPGADVQTATMLLVGEILPLWRRAATEQELLGRIQSTYRECDAMVKEDRSETAALWRGLRSLGWNGDLTPQLLEDLDGFTDLAAALPGSGEARRLLLAASARCTDVSVGLAALDRVAADAPPSQGLQELRARVAVRLAIASNGDHDEAIERALADLERAQGEDRDVHYLRGVLAWSRRGLPAAPADLLQRARDHFARSQRMACEGGAWSAAWAKFIAETAGGGTPDASEVDRVRGAARVEKDPIQLVPFAAFHLGCEPSPQVFQAAADLLSEIGPVPARRVVLAALAQAHAKLGDASAARRAAKEAMAVQVPPMHEAANSRGILVVQHLSCGWLSRTSGARVTVALSVDLLPLPDLPSRERLQQLARDG